ncbi:4060_t:CDS:2 [Acaulospora morrowiae]|uniref:4060_t:CDS:1 n=1 Tax=Acaulospora morrowiae TaxID=94023 RepID=A0A9N8WAB5_9GLOM|nr:4060_t:CDS:2 [Acaulospora morrowiae]
MNLNGNLHKEQCLPALYLMQNPVPALLENQISAPEGDLISFNEDSLTYQPAQPKGVNASAVNLLTEDISDIEAEAEYDIAEEELDIHFKKNKNPYINRKSKTENFNKGEDCDYYVFVPKGYFSEEEVFLEISAFRPLRGSNYLSLLEALDKHQLGLINLQNNDDNEYFKWCISAYHIRKEVLKANRKPPHLNEIRRLK